jgi:hypothetical protein
MYGAECSQCSTNAVDSDQDELSEDLFVLTGVRVIILKNKTPYQRLKAIE